MYVISWRRKTHFK